MKRTSRLIQTLDKSILENFLDKLEETCAAKNKLRRTVFFHNLSRFDGLLIFKRYAAGRRKKYRLKPLMRNNKLYELKICDVHNKLIICFRDSLLLLPSALAELGKNILSRARKGEIPHKTLQVFELPSKRREIMQYLKQDVILLGGVMAKAQEIIWNKFQTDLEHDRLGPCTKDTSTKSASRCELNLKSLNYLRKLFQSVL